MKRANKQSNISNKRNIKTRQNTKDKNDKDNLTLELFQTLDKTFLENPFNKIIQNAISVNSIADVCQDRSYMQSISHHFSNVIEPQLINTNQAHSGRCWIFAVLNVARHKTICKYQLQDDFEFSQCYLSFWDKLEKCNYFLNEIIKNRQLHNFLNDNYVVSLLSDPVSDGGYWITCKNLIKKYGLVPQTCFDESYNSSNTEELNYILECKLRQYAHELHQTIDENECYVKKKQMIETIFHIMCKLFGSPKLPNVDFTWEYYLDRNKDIVEMIDRQKKRQKTGEYKNLNVKKILTTNAIRYYNEYIPFECDDMIHLAHDPRNEYNKCYTNEKNDFVYDGEKSLFLNLDINYLVTFAKTSILNNTPVIFMCDVHKHMNCDSGLLDTKCYDFQSVFNTSFDEMGKANRILFRESQATHAMTIIGVDLDVNGNPIKWDVENSWGTKAGNFTMSNDWFLEYVFDVFIDKQYIDKNIMNIYNKEMIHPKVLPFDDPFV